MLNRIACASLALLLSLMTLSQSRAASWLELNFWLSGPRYDREMPPCDYPWALNNIMSDFQNKETVFWNSSLQIVGIDHIQQTAVLPWAAQSMPQRFCSGTARVSDGSSHRIFYSIAEATSLIGVGWGINFCVVGLDRDFAYGPHCRAARP